MSTVTAFLSDAMIASGERTTVTRQLEGGYPNELGEIVVIEDATGRRTDLDYWDAMASRQPAPPGRPRIGVKAREVTLLPRHWDWLAAQPGGASAALRRLVDAAQREAAGDPRARKDAIYCFLQATSGDRAGYEEALRALYKDDEERFDEIVADWPVDIRRYLARVGQPC